MPGELDFFFTFHYLSPLIKAAFGTSLMRRLGFQALGTNAGIDRLQKVMRPALSSARLGMSPLWIRHEY